MHFFPPFFSVPSLLLSCIYGCFRDRFLVRGKEMGSIIRINILLGIRQLAIEDCTVSASESRLCLHVVKHGSVFP